MAHTTLKTSYANLTERLNRFPQGAPPSELLFQILGILFSEREAQLVSELPIRPFTARRASRIWKKDLAETQKVLDELASRAILDAARGQTDASALAEQVERALASQFRPEFLNRIDEVIRFQPLGPADLQRIVRLQVVELAQLLQEQGLALQVDEPVVAWLAEQGYEPEYGARPLRRLLRRQIENPLATQLLEERFLGASAVQVSLGEGGQALCFKPISGPE